MHGVSICSESATLPDSLISGKVDDSPTQNHASPPRLFVEVTKENMVVGGQARACFDRVTNWSDLSSRCPFVRRKEKRNAIRSITVGMLSLPSTYIHSHSIHYSRMINCLIPDIHIPISSVCDPRVSRSTCIANAAGLSPASIATGFLLATFLRQRGGNIPLVS